MCYLTSEELGSTSLADHHCAGFPHCLNSQIQIRLLYLSAGVRGNDSIICARDADGALNQSGDSIAGFSIDAAAIETGINAISAVLDGLYRPGEFAGQRGVFRVFRPDHALKGVLHGIDNSLNGL
jgi:hypothetical protein